MHWILVANGIFHPSPRIMAVLDTADVLVGVDGGGCHLHRLGRTPDLVLGDMDSISGDILKQYRDRNIPMHLHPPRKDATDLELAIELAAEKGATSLTILGATGGRPDHALGNLFLLQACLEHNLPACILSDEGAAYLISGTLHLKGQPGDILSLIPVTPEVCGVNLQGLEYPLHDATLPFGTTRGISNIFTRADISISIRSGRLLAFHLNAP